MGLIDQVRAWYAHRKELQQGITRAYAQRMDRELDTSAELIESGVADMRPAVGVLRECGKQITHFGRWAWLYTTPALERVLKAQSV
jgi:hypothetical protein